MSFQHDTKSTKLFSQIPLFLAMKVVLVSHSHGSLTVSHQMSGI